MKYLDIYAYSLQYKSYIEQRFGDKSKNPLYKPEIMINVDQIRDVKVGLAQMLTKSNQPDAPCDHCVFIDYKDQNNQLRQMIVIAKTFGEHNSLKCQEIVENIKFRKLLFASGTAYLTSQLAQLKALEADSVDLQSPHHFRALCQAGQAVFGFLQQEMQFPKQPQDGTEEVENKLENFCLKLETDHPFWKRIGFQNSRPQTDFRAAGLFGLLAIVYVSHQSPDFLLNGSYQQKILQVEDFEEYSRQLLKKRDVEKKESQGWAYNYPVAISVITIAHALVDLLQKFPQQMQKLLLNEFIADYAQIFNNAAALKTIIAKNPLLQATSLLVNHEAQSAKEEDTIYQEQLSQVVQKLNEMLGQLEAGPENVEQLFAHIMAFNPTPIQVVPLGPIVLDEQMLSGAEPRFGGQFFKMVGYLALELNRRLSGYHQNQQYVMYQGQFGVLMQNVNQVIQMTDLLGVDDLISRVREMW